MILHPGILALLTGTLVVVAMFLYSSWLSVRIIRFWDISSSSEQQLTLERRTYLVSTIMNYVFGFEILSALLFLYTLDGLHPIFVGAMCATGSLNANPVGWYALYTKTGLFFLAGIWIAINRIDQKAFDFPLVRVKYILLLWILPFVLLDAYLLFSYFLGLKPNIITSCCGALFSESGKGLASGLSTLPIRPTMFAFYTVAALFVFSGIASFTLKSSSFRYGFAFLSLAVFLVSMAGIVSFVSLYFYEIPTHHCPFDIFQGNYHYIGYPLYSTLFAGSYMGMMTGITEPLRKVGSLTTIIEASQKKWTVLSLTCILLFMVLSTWPILFSDFTLEGYY